MTGARCYEMDDSDSRQPPSGKMPSGDQHNRSNQCDCCFETVKSKKTVKLPGCGHVYCADCLRVMYRMAITNEAHFPPSCCSGAIDLKSVKHLLHRPQLKAYERCAAEYTTPVLDRRYCVDTRCNSFLGRANGGILRCGKCGKLTCDVCKDHVHPGECKEERGRDVHKLDADLERLAAEEGWQRCPSCSRMVVLGEGFAVASMNFAMSAVPSGRLAPASNGKMLIYKHVCVKKSKLHAFNDFTMNLKKSVFWKCIYAIYAKSNVTTIGYCVRGSEDCGAFDTSFRSQVALDEPIYVLWQSENQF
ncbi:hypothetical protein KCU65_g4467, partial [Aureobasidium melanogenum]